MKEQPLLSQNLSDIKGFVVWIVLIIEWGGGANIQAAGILLLAAANAKDCQPQQQELNILLIVQWDEFESDDRS